MDTFVDFELVLRALHRAAAPRADRHGRRRLLDERRPVYRRRRARDPAPALLALLRPGDDADRAPAGEGGRAVRRAVHPRHGHARDLFDREPTAARSGTSPSEVVRDEAGARLARRHAGRDRAVGQDVEVEEERGRSRRHHRPLRRRHRALVRAVRQPARARRGMDRRRRRGGAPPPRAGLAAGEGGGRGRRDGADGPGGGAALPGDAPGDPRRDRRHRGLRLQQGDRPALRADRRRSARRRAAATRGARRCGRWRS